MTRQVTATHHLPHHRPAGHRHPPRSHRGRGPCSSRDRRLRRAARRRNDLGQDDFAAGSCATEGGNYGGGDAVDRTVEREGWCCYYGRDVRRHTAVDDDGDVVGVTGVGGDATRPATMLATRNWTAAVT